MFPIVLFTYNRPEHTLQVLEALKNNNLSNQSKLYVFVDGPKENASDETIKQIEEVCSIVKSKQWCGEVEYHISQSNIGCRNSIINGISQVLESNEAVIVLEDDIITSKYFLTFMNHSLMFYKNRKTVYSISGWNYPTTKLKIPEDYEYDVYLSLRLLNWGWGTWKDRWCEINWDKTFIPSFLENKYFCQSFNRAGDDMCKMLLEEYEGKSSAWDIQFAYHTFKNGGYSIVPCNSYTNNIGLDGSGTHCVSNINLKNDLSKCKDIYNLLDVLYLDNRFINAFYNINCTLRRPFYQKVVNTIYRKLGKQAPFVIKKKILNQ